MIKGSQINTASQVARDLEEIKMKIRDLQKKLGSAQLNDDASKLGGLAEHCWEISHGLERKALESFLAARRGEELPQ